MSAIPPNLIGSVLGSAPAQRSQGVDRATADSRASAVSRELAGADGIVDIEIEATDSDTRVHSDAGGQGSAGRQDQESGSAEEHEAPAEASEPGTHRLDIQA